MFCVDLTEFLFQLPVCILLKHLLVDLRCFSVKLSFLPLKHTLAFGSAQIINHCHLNSLLHILWKLCIFWLSSSLTLSGHQAVCTPWYQSLWNVGWFASKMCGQVISYKVCGHIPQLTKSKTDVSVSISKLACPWFVFIRFSWFVHFDARPWAQPWRAL